MANRVHDMGMDRALGSRLLAKYDPSAENEVREWIHQVVGVNIPAGADNFARELKSGYILCNLAAAVFDGSTHLPNAASNFRPNIKPSQMNIAFKQMENIEVFLKAAEAYGVPTTSLFPTTDLFEGRNLGTVIACIQSLGSEAQRNGFNGPTCGPRPTTKNRRHFEMSQLKAGDSIIGLQAGTNKFASQKGMSMGAVRHIADIRADDISQEGHGIINLQSGTNKFASQKGMSFGAVRHIADIRADDMTLESQGVINLQAGTNKYASQKGMSLGSLRHVTDIRADDMSQESQGVINLQAGTNQFASQKGMSMGSVRHVADIRADAMNREAQGVIGLQAGTNQFASLRGYGFGRQRGITDIKVGQGPHQNVYPALFYTDFNNWNNTPRYYHHRDDDDGTNKFASQKGMTFGKGRGVSDIKISKVTDDIDDVRF